MEWESWDYAFSFPGGWRLLAQFQITNAGPGRRHGLVTAVIVEPDGSTRLLRNSRPRERWRWETSADQVRVELHTHLFAMGPARHELSLRHRMGRFEVTALPAAPAVDLGRVSGPGGSAFELAVLASRLRARGSVQLPGRPALELRDGWGVASRSRSTVPVHRQMLGSVALHTFDPSAQISLFALAPPEPGQPFGWLLLVREPGTVEVTRAVERHWSGAVREDESPRYSTPRWLDLRTGSGLAEAHVRLQPLARYDVLGWIQNRIVRWLAGRVSHPVQYVFEADYALRAGPRPGETASGRGLLLLSILDQPRAEWP